MRIDDLNGKAALVTGSSTGIGAAVARGFGAQGMMVAVHGNSSIAEAEAVAAEVEAAGGRAIVLKADVRDIGECTRLVQEAYAAFGRLDVLVNNAGISHAGAPGRTLQEIVASNQPSVASLPELRRVFETNVFGVVAVTQAMLPLMRRPPRNPRRRPRPPLPISPPPA